MPLIAGILIFIVLMTGLSIPIIAIFLNRPQKYGNATIKRLEARINELEQKVDTQDIEIQELTNNLNFTTRLIEKK